MLIKKDNIVHGVDVAKNNLKKAKRKGLIVKQISTKTKILPYSSNSFDVVLLADVIEHVFDTDALLRESRRVLKRNGKLILTTPNVASLGRRIMLLIGISPYLEYSLELLTNEGVPVGHVRYYTVETLKKQLIFNQFQEIKIEGDRINISFLRIRFFGKIFPSLCTMLLCTAIKK